MNPDPKAIRLVMELRAKGISDLRVLSAIERTPRDLFVMDAFQDRAWDNTPLPIEDGQTISQPFVVAYMTAALKLGDRMRVLEIGTGSGYQAAVLSGLCRMVYSVEQSFELRKYAEKRFKNLRISNVVTMRGDGRYGWPQQAPFDRIILTAAAPETPTFIENQLQKGGIAVAPVGGPLEQEIMRFTRIGDGLESETLLRVRFVPLVAPS